MRRTLVVGLDGMEKRTLERLAATGVMPHVARLLEGEHLAALRAPVPEVSSTSWATFLTGVQPGRHGIFGFIDLEPGSYTTYFPNLDDLAAPALWQLAAGAGLRTLCLNVPSTYPAHPMEGVLISGFVAPLPERAVHPPELSPRLAAMGYELDVDVGDAADAPRAFLARLQRCLEARRRVFAELLAGERWQLAIAVITETDRLQHYLWRDLVDPTRPLHREVLEVYRQVDLAVRDLIAAAGDPESLFLVSDHGFAGVDRSLYVNAWLRQRGYLALPADAGSLAGLDERTVAFALDPARIYLHRRGAFPRGGVEARAAEALSAALRDELRAWRAPDDGGPVFAEVLTAHEAYGGGCLPGAPDLIGVPAPGRFVRGSFRHAEVVGHDAFTGAHTRDNAIFFARGAHDAPGVVDMCDVAPTVLASLGVTGVARFDGRNLMEAS